MPRNLRRRVEVLCPVEDPDLKQKLRTQMLSGCTADTLQAWDLQSDGTYRRIVPTNGESAISLQDVMMDLARGKSPEIPDFFSRSRVPPPSYGPHRGVGISKRDVPKAKQAR